MNFAGKICADFRDSRCSETGLSLESARGGLETGGRSAGDKGVALTVHGNKSQREMLNVGWAFSTAVCPARLSSENIKERNLQKSSSGWERCRGEPAAIAGLPQARLNS